MVHAYLEPAELEAVKRKQPSGVTNAEWLLSAVEAQHAAVLNEFKTGPAQMGEGLFNTAQYRKKSTTTEKSQYGARLHSSDISILQNLVSQVHGVSMSAFIAACLKRHTSDPNIVPGTAD